MTDEEILEWLALLSPKQDVQLTIVKDLLRHANEDEMSVGDRISCVRALTLLGV